MILHGLTITIVGMAIVFAFLTILVLAMNLLFAMLKRFFPNSLRPGKDGPEAESQEMAPAQAQANGASELAKIAAVIAATKSHILTHYRG